MSRQPQAWTPDSWRTRPPTQMPDYGNDTVAHAVVSRLRAYPALVTVQEIIQLRQRLAGAAQARALVLQAGDCAEHFEGLRSDTLDRHYQLLRRMAQRLEQDTGLTVLRIGRIAGQYAKPRSRPDEPWGGLRLPSYRGDIINGSALDPVARRHDPARMEHAYFHAAASLNFLRGLDSASQDIAPGNYYTSHEALLLPYEQASLLRGDDGRCYVGTGHFLWVGERTRQLDGAHVEFLRGVHNPIGIKLGPTIGQDELLRLIEVLNPGNEPGRLTLIPRLGARSIHALPALLATVRDAGRQVLWLCDPMHGNGRTTAAGVKTRHYDDIAAEVEGYVRAHQDCCTHVGGLHLEVSGDEVTECLGGPQELDEDALGLAYRSACDPRLNPEQAMALCGRFVDAWRLERPTAAAQGATPAPTANANLAARLVASRGDSHRTCFQGPGFQLSYRELDRAVRRQAASLELAGVKVDDRILVALDDGPELAVIFFAALAIGALPAAVSPRLDASSLAQVLADARPTLSFTHAGLAALWPHRRGLHIVAVGAHREWLEGCSDDDGWNGFAFKTADAPALIQYTSGSTGQSKGVLHSARSVLAACEHFAAGQLRLREDDLLYSVPKSFFGYGMGNSLFFPLYLGARAVLDPQWPSAARVMFMLRQFRPTVLFAVPALYRMLLEEGLTAAELPVRLAFSAGAPLPPHTAQRWKQRFGFDLHDGIGATELCHVFATSYPDALCAGKVGRMLPGCLARIVDSHGAPTPPGEVGVLHVKAASMAIGYWCRPDEDRARFQDGWYRTGDLFSQDEDSLLTFHGREDDRFKVNGRWVAPVEIESLLGTLLPELFDCYLVPGRDDKGEDRPVLFVRGSAPSNELVGLAQARLEAHLKSYKRPVHVAALVEIPLNRNGKPDRQAMARQASLLLQQKSEIPAC